MARLADMSSWRSVFALASLLTFYALMAYASIATISLGGTIYILAILVITLGFWSQEDSIAIGGIAGISLLVILDVLLRIGVLGFNGIRIIGAAGH